MSGNHEQKSGSANQGERDSIMSKEELDNDAMLIARKMIEDHIECYGMVPHPDRIKERIAGALRIAFEQGRALAPLRDIEF